MQRIRKNNCNHLKPTTKQTSWSYFPGQAVQKLQNEAEYPASTLQCLPLIAMITWLLRQREKHRPLQRRTTPFVPWPGHGCSTSSSLTGFSLPFLLFLETLPSVLNVWMVLTSNLSLSWSHSVAGRHGDVWGEQYKLTQQLQVHGLQCLGLQHLSTFFNRKRWEKMGKASWFHNVSSFKVCGFEDILERLWAPELLEHPSLGSIRVAHIEPTLLPRVAR